MALRSRERGGCVHQAKRPAVLPHGLSELGVLLLLLCLDLTLGIIPIGNVLHERGRGHLVDFVVRVVERG